MTTAYTLLALYTLAGLLTYPVMQFLMHADLVDDVLEIAIGWREHVVLLGFTLLLWPLFIAMLMTGYIWQKRRESPEGQAQIERRIAESKRQQELDDTLTPWGDYTEIVREPLTPEEADEILTSGSFREHMQPGDILFHFATSAYTWQHNAGRAGVVLMRDRKPIVHIITMMN